jgi:diguanylate cyclase (GGDEF)-like protein
MFSISRFLQMTTPPSLLRMIRVRFNVFAEPRSMARAVANKVIVFVALLLIAIQLMIFVAIDRSVASNARQKIREELQVGERIFLRLLEARSQQLITASSVLTSDFGFRQALLTGDRGTVTSAMSNHGDRIGASQMILVGLDNRVLADISAVTEASGDRLFAFPDLVIDASKTGSTSAVRLINGVAYQLVVVPVLAPSLAGWMVVGFNIDSKLATDLGSLTSLDVSFATWQEKDGWQVNASTESIALLQRLKDGLSKTPPASIASRIATFSGDDYVTSVTTLTLGADGAVVAILQHSLDEAIARFQSLRLTLLALAAMSLCGTVIGSVLIARSISRPVTALVNFARRLERGDYEQAPPEIRGDELGELAHAFDSMRLAISAREQQITAMAYHDALTGLPNRALFNDRLSNAIDIARRLSHPVSVVLIDLNRFKEINDTFGHHVGDLLLREVSTRLRGALMRASDTVARLGGDEFAIIFPATNSFLALEAVRKVRNAFKAPVAFENRFLDIEGSFGIATFPEHGEDPHLLVSHADAAMYHAKRKRLGFAVYEEQYEMGAEIDTRLSLASELGQAVENNELILYYQPRISLGPVVDDAVEALVRWQHPVRGFLSPDEFIPFAEQSGYIREITYWVISCAFAQAAQWRAQGSATVISINLSVRDLLSTGFAERCSELLQQHNVAPEAFIFEITESVIMDDPDKALGTAHQLHRMGFRLSIDDFGIGYSSLGLIKKLPIAELKIDRSFVMDMVADTEDLAIVRSVIDLAHNMGLIVVAEGVESADALALLAEMGCDAAQGYHICKPVPAYQVDLWLAQRKRAAVLPDQTFSNSMKGLT